MRRKRDEEFPENGFEGWGNYMNAKIAKLEDQYAEKVENNGNKLSDIFNGISIFVNGYTKPSADQLKCLMSEHGGTYHHYFRFGKTKFIIASNLPDTKVKNLPSTKIIKPEWITDSIEAGSLLDYKNYILYSNQSRTQPALNFKIAEKPSPVKNDVNTRTAVDPKFLEEYHSNSRLHHISQLGGEFKEHVNNLRSESDFKFPLRERLKQTCTQNMTQIDKTIMHIDMDCFFVSVGLRSHPELKGLPVAVTHAKNTSAPQQREGVDVQKEFRMYAEKRNRTNQNTNDDGSNHRTFGSMSEIASCSYEARALGLRNGMFMGEALRLCPDLKTISYNFDEYKEVAYELYNTIAQYTLDIEAVSCDEMYVDCTELLNDVRLSPLDFATILRKEIKDKTDCPCSVGFGTNRLQARLATKKAKPDGQFHLDNESVESFFSDIPLGDLPGVGRQMLSKLKSLGFTNCESLRKANPGILRKHFGEKTALLLYNYCRGKDDKPLQFDTVRKSISVNANYGIRFNDTDECTRFLEQLCSAVHDRMTKHNVTGKSVTLKLMMRAENAPVETAKFMGHGICDNITKTSNLSTPTNDLKIITSEVLHLCKKLKVEPQEMRGICVQISRLQSLNKKETKRLGIHQFLVKKSTNTFENPFKDRIQLNVKRRGRPPKNSILQKKPPIKKNVNNIDKDVLKALPDDIRMEVIEDYNLDNEPVIIDEEDHSSNSGENSNEGMLNMDWKDVCEMLKIWMDSDSAPLDCDVRLLKNYVQNMIAKRKIEDVYDLMNFTYRQTLPLERCDWHRVYRDIEKCLQETMLMVYERKMGLFNKYTCCGIT